MDDFSRLIKVFATSSSSYQKSRQICFNWKYTYKIQWKCLADDYMGAIKINGTAILFSFWLRKK